MNEHVLYVVWASVAIVADAFPSLVRIGVRCAAMRRIQVPSSFRAHEPYYSATTVRSLRFHNEHDGVFVKPFSYLMTSSDDYGELPVMVP